MKQEEYVRPFKLAVEYYYKTIRAQKKCAADNHAKTIRTFSKFSDNISSLGTFLIAQL